MLHSISPYFFVCLLFLSLIVLVSSSNAPEWSLYKMTCIHGRKHEDVTTLTWRLMPNEKYLMILSNLTHPWKLIWQLKSNPLKMYLLFEMMMFHCHVSFREGKPWSRNVDKTYWSPMDHEAPPSQRRPRHFGRPLPLNFNAAESLADRLQTPPMWFFLSFTWLEKWQNDHENVFAFLPLSIEAPVDP